MSKWPASVIEAGAGAAMRRMFAAALVYFATLSRPFGDLQKAVLRGQGRLSGAGGTGAVGSARGLARLRGYSAHEGEQGVEDLVLLLCAADPGREIASLLSVPAELRMVAAPNRDLERD